MAKVRSINITFPPSGSLDVVEYRMYYVDAGEILDYDSPNVSLGKPDADTDGKIRVDIANIGVFSDGRYDIGVVAVDDAGNESSMSTMMDVPFDFVAPDAPGIVEVEVV